MRKFILAITATVSLAAMSVTAGAMPISGAVALGVQANPNIAKAEVIIRRTIIRRPLVRPFVRRVPVRRCTTVVTAGRRVTRCVVR